ncbi:MAG: YitT family protein, partial [Lachnospiraceae bacterium]|nr:YitT family protein [Lachnospiraceae bacterium]
MILGIKIEPKKDLIRLAVVVAAAFLMALNVKSFVRTGGLFPGGVSGLTLLIQRALLRFTGIEIPYSILNILLN